MSQQECKTFLIQSIELKPTRSNAAHTTLEITIDRLNGFVRVVETTGCMAWRFENPVDVAPVCGKENTWVLLSKGQEPVILSRNEYGSWVLHEAHSSGYGEIRR